MIDKSAFTNDSSFQLPIARVITACEAAIVKVTSNIGEYWEFGTSHLPPEEAADWGDKESYVARCEPNATFRQKRLLQVCKDALQLGATTVSVSLTDLEHLTSCHKPD